MEEKQETWKKQYKEILEPSVEKRPERSFLEDFPTDSQLNNPIQLRGFDDRHPPQGQPGRLYYDRTSKKIKIYIDAQSGWGDIVFTTTSTSTSSSTSSSTSTSTSTTTT